MSDVMDLLSMVLATMVVALTVLSILLAIALRHLAYRFKHERKAPEGNFKVKLPEKEWADGVQKGAFGIAIKNREGTVLMTVVVERESKCSKEAGK